MLDAQLGQCLCNYAEAIVVHRCICDCIAAGAAMICNTVNRTPEMTWAQTWAAADCSGNVCMLIQTKLQVTWPEAWAFGKVSRCRQVPDAACCSLAISSHLKVKSSTSAAEWGVSRPTCDPKKRRQQVHISSALQAATRRHCSNHATLSYSEKMHQLALLLCYEQTGC